MSDLSKISNSLNDVGWFIPPYVGVGLLDEVAFRISSSRGGFTQDDIERVLSNVYDADRLASMTVSRYSSTPTIELFVETIRESIAAHFLRLGHVAVSGLIPVVEGAARRLAHGCGVRSTGSIVTVLRALASHARKDVEKRKIGVVEEIVAMLDSFTCFVDRYLYVDTGRYALPDRTNRHGILHGTYADADYGKPINFYKTIAAIDFLTFISSLNTKRISGFVPNSTSESIRLAEAWRGRRRA